MRASESGQATGVVDSVVQRDVRPIPKRNDKDETWPSWRSPQFLQFYSVHQLHILSNVHCPLLHFSFMKAFGVRYPLVFSRNTSYRSITCINEPIHTKIRGLSKNEKCEQVGDAGVLKRLQFVLHRCTMAGRWPASSVRATHADRTCAAAPARFGGITATAHDSCAFE